MHFNRFVALASVSLISMVTPAMAQDAATENESVANSSDIIVEARRREESIQDVPLVVNAVTAETVDKLNIRNAGEITAIVPGLSLTVNANGIGSSSSMRGINHDVNVSGENGTIQYYVNDVPVASNFVLQAMYDIGQITVERGPQGTLRGRSTPSGAININWRRPDLSEVGGFVSGSAGSAAARNVQFGIGVPIIADMLAIRVAGLLDKNRGNRITSVNSTVEPDAETQSIRAAVNFEPFEFFKAGFVFQSLTYDATQFDQVQSMSQVIPGFTTPAIQQAISPPLPFTTIIGAPQASTAGNYGTVTLADRRSVQFTPRRISQDFKYYGWNAEVNLAGQRLIYVGSKLNFTYNPITDQDNGAIFPALTLQQETFTTNSTATHELRLQNDERIAGMFDYVVGYFKSSASPETRLTSPSTIRAYFPLTPPTVPIPTGFTLLQGVTSFIPIGTAIYLPKGNTQEKSFFGNVTAHLSDATEISVGARRVNFTSASAGLYISCTPAQYAAGSCNLTPGTANSYDVSKWVYSVSARHRFSDDLMVYAATGSSFRPPVRAIGAFTSATSPRFISHTEFGPETSKSYEIGLKSSWLDRKVMFNATYYHQDFKSYPYRAGGAGVYYINVDALGQANRSQFNFISAVPVKVDGVEAELAFNPSSQFSVSTSINWSKSSIGKSSVACTDALNNTSGAVGSDGIADSVVPTLAQMQSAYGAGEYIAECAGGGSATFLPEWSGSVRAEYNLPISDSADIYLRGLLAYRGSTANDPGNPYDNVGAYGLLNLYGGIRASSGAWELGVYAKNVSNVTKLTQGNDNGFTASTTLINAATSRPFGSATYSSNYRGVAVTPPREVGVTFKFAFGSR